MSHGLRGHQILRHWLALLSWTPWIAPLVQLQCGRGAVGWLSCPEETASLEKCVGSMYWLYGPPMECSMAGPHDQHTARSTSHFTVFGPVPEATQCSLSSSSARCSAFATCRHVPVQVCAGEYHQLRAQTLHQDVYSPVINVRSHRTTVAIV